MYLQAAKCGSGCRSRYEFEYERGGTLAYLVAWDVHHAKLFDRVEETTGIEPFGRLVEQVMTTEPYLSAKTVYWVVDNGSSHAGKTSLKRMSDRWPNARLIHLPVHASWLNQIELYFSILQRSRRRIRAIHRWREAARSSLAGGHGQLILPIGLAPDAASEAEVTPRRRLALT